MAKSGKPEKITPPSAKVVKTSAQQLPQGGTKAGPAGRVLSEKETAIQQGARRRSPKA